MSEHTPTGPAPRDLGAGVPLADIPDGGSLAGTLAGKSVLLVRQGDRVFAVAARCTHYGANLAGGLVVDATIRCPHHHACFDLATGQPLRAPAMKALDRWAVSVRDGRVFVGEKQAAPEPVPVRSEASRMVIVGGGAAGFAAAQMLRRQGFAGEIVMFSSEQAPPIDRPNLSKDYLAGGAPEDWLPMAGDDDYRRQNITLHLGRAVAAIDVAGRRVIDEAGAATGFDGLLIATGAEPRRLDIPGAGPDNVLLLRSLEDCRRIIAKAQGAKRAVVLGSGFIGLEVAASLRARGLSVVVVTPDSVPLERQFGSALGRRIQSIHEAQGVVFRFGARAIGISGTTLGLSDGAQLEADIVVAGIGVRPRTALAERAGLAVDDGILVDAFLETGARGIFAAGDVARWADRRSPDPLRVEHWVTAERQGQVAAMNMLGQRVPFDAVPFFWSQHFDTRVNFVGYPGAWDDFAVEGDIGADCTVRFYRGGRVRGVATIGRDLDSLRAEREMETAVAG